MDLIDRQAAIDEIAFSKEMLNRVLDDMDVVGVDREKYAWGLGLIESLIDDIRELPSAHPERRTGEWKPFDRTWGRSIYHCTACGEAEDCPTEMGRVIWRFCPNCGAKMEGGKDEC